ncbi:hypothetical protein ABZZ20_25730 [Streptomyces sp. NPDC006430]|uniref:hypothetical protein n=1 Tax=Streptomyces sp. NPDC006430 TaxID=3154299 RepID=UPI0033B622B7
MPPPPAGGQPPTLWGDEAHVRRLFAEHEVSVSTEQVGFTFPTPLAAAEFWVRTAGHLQAEHDRLEADGAWLAQHQDLAAVFTEWNRNNEAGTDVRVESAYLLAVIQPTA